MDKYRHYMIYWICWAASIRKLPIFVGCKQMPCIFAFL